MRNLILFELVLSATVLAHALCLPAAHADPTLFLENAALPSWSPDGGTIACVRAFAEWRNPANLQIWLAPQTGAPARLASDPGGGSWPLWLPDGQHLAYFNQRLGARVTYEFVVVDLQGNNPVVWEVEHLDDDAGISLSPNGGSVLYTQASGDTWSLDLTTGVRTFVVAGSGGVISPDGEWVAYRNPLYELLLAPLGQPPVHNLGWGLFGSWTPDSRYVVFTRLVGNGGDLVIAGREGSYRRDLTNDPELEWYARVSPSGNSVAYTRSVGRSGPPSIYIVSLPPVAVESETWTRIKQIYR